MNEIGIFIAGLFWAYVAFSVIKISWSIMKGHSIKEVADAYNEDLVFYKLKDKEKK